MRIENRVKTTLQAGGVTVGVFIQMPSPDIVELVVLAGFDFALLDGEHGRISPDDAYPMILAGEARDIDVMARIGQNDRQVILKHLDLGVSGVCPGRTTWKPPNARSTPLRHWPRGGRGLAGGRTFDYAVGAPMAERVPAINDRVLSIIQFENIGALDHLDELLALPELDVLFVGPTDLAQSMGYPGQPGHPDVEKVIAQVRRRARGSRVALGTVAGDAELSNRRIAQGFRMIVANVPALLFRSSRALLDSIDRDGAARG